LSAARIGPAPALATNHRPRRTHDPATKDYIERRIAEGKSRREATRLLKR
jgi:hypothetical protein